MFVRLFACRTSSIKFSVVNRQTTPSWTNKSSSKNLFPLRPQFFASDSGKTDGGLVAGTLKEVPAKPPPEKRLEAIARSYVPSSMKKLNEVSRLVRGLSYNEAMAQLKFSPRRAAWHLAKVVESARVNAENTFSLNPDRLVVAHIILGRETYRKEMNIQHKGVGIIHHPKCNIKVILREVPVVPGEKRLGIWGRERKFIRRTDGTPRQAKSKLKEVPLPETPSTPAAATP